MKKCVIVGNCHHKILENLLNGRIDIYGGGGYNNFQTNFSKSFEILPTYDIYVKNKTNLDEETINKADLIIIQEISENHDVYFNTKNLLSHKKDSAIVIKIPNFWFAGIFPQNTKNEVIRPAPGLTIAHSGLFPYGDGNIIEMLKEFKINTYDILDGSKNIIDIRNIINMIYETVNSDNFYDKNFILKHFENSYKAYKEREDNFKLDIKSADFIYKNPELNLPTAINHPNINYFFYVIEQIYDILGISFDDFKGQKLDFEPFNGFMQVPIYASVLKVLSIQHRQDNLFHFGKLISHKEYYENYILHILGANIKNQQSNIKKLNCHFYISDLTKVVLDKNDRFDNYLLESKITNIDPKNNIVRKDKEYKDIKIIFNGKHSSVALYNCSTTKPILIVCSGDYSTIILDNVKFDGEKIIINAGKCCSIDIVHSTIREDNLFLASEGKSIKISKNCLFERNILISTSANYPAFNNKNERLNPSNNVIIEENVIISHDCKILSGSKVGSNSFLSPFTILDYKEINANSYVKSNINIEIEENTYHKRVFTRNDTSINSDDFY